ncbi:DNA topoisomerase, partial [Listeria monocytogenes]|uniref:DNA topoisomerase n=1 Tax=Listeria monocytogenes TaxID=1639 RepID=UPI002B25120B
VQQLKLKSIGKIPLQQGWQEILRIKSKKKEAQTLPPIVENEEAEVELKSMEKETQAPEAYTEGTLITAMKTAGKTLD